MKNRSIVVLMLLVLLLGLALAPVTAQDVAEPALTYDTPDGYDVTGPNNMQKGDEVIIVIDPAKYEQVISTSTFDDDASALSFFLKRIGYTVGASADTPNDKVLASNRVSLSRREQQGTAYLLDLSVGVRSVVISLHTGRGRVGAPPVDANVVLDSIAFPMDIVQAATKDGDFSILLEALQTADLETMLHGDGPFTLFAPNDDAFQSLFESLGISKDQLMAAPYLKDVLLYHIVNGSVDSATLNENYLDQTSMPTALALNNVFAFTGVDGNLYLNNNQSQIVQTDIMATNGVIHVISGVLLPQCAIDAINGTGGCS